MFTGDDLTVVLFLLGTAITLAVTAMAMAGWRHPALIVGLFIVAAICAVSGVGWQYVKPLSPILTAQIGQVSTNPVAWFVVFILGLMASLFSPKRRYLGEAPRPPKDATTSEAISRSIRRQWLSPTLVVVLLLISMVAVTTDLVGRYLIAQTVQISPIVDYGHQPPTGFFMTIDGRRLSDYAADFKAVLLVQSRFVDIDRMSNTNIERSSPYTITNEQITLFLTTTGHMRLVALQANLVEFDLVVLPKNILPTQIASLDDVKRLGGKIIATTSQGGVIGGPPDGQPIAPKGQ